MVQECLKVEHLSKDYAEGFAVIGDASLTIAQGEIHGLLGENGAGKSTFIKILAGMTTADSGNIWLMGKPIAPRTPQEAVRLGIVRLQKQSGLVPSLTVEENILLGRQKLGFAPLDRKRMRREIAALLQEFSMDPQPQDRARNITAEDALETEVLKAYYAGAKLIILDEPSSYFSLAQTEELFALLRRVAAKGVAILYVSSKVQELRELCDRITVMQDGVCAPSLEAAQASARQLQQMMAPPSAPPVVKALSQPGDTVLKVRGLSVFRNPVLPAPEDIAHPVLNDLSFSLREGEILAVVGKPDSGARELCEVIVGMRRAVTGQVLIYDDDVMGDSVRGVRDMGVSFLITTDRNTGVAPALSIQENLLPYQYTNPAYRSNGLLDQEKLKAESDRLIREYRIRCSSGSENAGSLSVSSARKLLAAREFTNGPVLLVAYQPTLGTSENTAAFLEQKLVELRDSGTAILLVATDEKEFSDLADRAIVLSQGKLCAYFPRLTGKEDLAPYINGERQMSKEEMGAVYFEG